MCNTEMTSLTDGSPVSASEQEALVSTRGQAVRGYGPVSVRAGQSRAEPNRPRVGGRALFARALWRAGCLLVRTGRAEYEFPGEAVQNE